MIKITIYKDDNDHYRGFVCSGHAGYDVYGSDIVCSSVSAIVIGTCNAIDALTDDTIDMVSDENSGYIDVSFPRGLGHDGSLLADAMVMSLKDIESSYGDFIELNIEEV